MSWIVEHPWWTAAIVAGALMVVFWLVVQLTVYPPAKLKDALLNRREQALVAAMADAFFPPGGPIPLSGCEAGVLEYLDAYLRRMDRGGRFLVHLLLVFMEYGPYLFGPRPRRFTRLRFEHQLRYLDGAFTSWIYFRRVSFVSLRALMTMAYLSNAEVAGHMRMTTDPDPFGIAERKPEGYEQPIAMTAPAAGEA